MKKDTKRLDSIKAANQSIDRKSYIRREDYLEIISELVGLKGYATTLDISRYMNVSPPSVTKMLQKLDKDGYLEYEKYHGIIGGHCVIPNLKLLNNESLNLINEFNEF